MEKSVKDYLVRLGCSSPRQLSLTYRVYIELLDVKLMHDVGLYYDIDSNVPYLTAKKSKTSEADVIVPHFATDPISIENVGKLQNSLCVENEPKRITLACVEGDSTVVFYTFSNGFVNPQNSEYFVRHKTKQETRNALDKELKRSAHVLLLKSYKNRIVDE